MPGNDISINNSIFYYVGDSKMDELIEWLDKNGIKENKKCVNRKNEEIVLVDEEHVDENVWSLKGM